MGKNIVHLDGVVGWDIMARDVNANLGQLDGDTAFELNTPGGYITEGVAILNGIRNYKKGKTYAHVAYAASMGTQIALGCDEVGIYDNGIFMIHNAQGGVYGDHNEQRKQADLQERMSNMLAQIYVKKTGLSLEEIKKMMDANTYLFGQEAVDLGFADFVIATDDVKDKVVAMAMADELFAKGMSALKEESLDTNALEANLRACEGNCTLGASPTAVIGDKSNTTHQGADMAKDQTLLGMLQARLGIGSDKTDIQAVDELETALKASNDALDVANTALATNTEAMNALTVKLAEAEQFKAEVNLRLLEAKQTGVSMDVAIAMIAAKTAEEASTIAIASKASDGRTQQGESNIGKEQEEVNYARSFAKSISVGGNK